MRIMRRVRDVMTLMHLGAEQHERRGSDSLRPQLDDLESRPTGDVDPARFLTSPFSHLLPTSQTPRSPTPPAPGSFCPRAA